MTWQPLFVINVEECFDKSLKKAVREVNASIETHLENRAKLDARVHEAQSQSAEEVDFDTALCMQSYRSQLATILQGEVRLRKQIEGFEDRVREGIAKGAEAAAAEHQKATQEVRVALAQIGYLDVDVSEQVVGKITPGMVMAHPRVFAALNESRSLQQKTSTRDYWRANEESLALVQSELRREHERLIPK